MPPIGGQAISEAVVGLSGTPVLLFAALIVAMCCAMVVWQFRSVLKYLTNRNGKMEAAMGKLGDQNEACIRLLQRVADRLGATTGE